MKKTNWVLGAVLSVATSAFGQAPAAPAAGAAKAAAPAQDAKAGGDKKK